MAIIKCPECGHEISDTCDKCVHCGYQLRKPSQTNQAGSSYSRPIHVESHANKIYERDQHIKWIGGIVAGVLVIILGIILCILSAFKEATMGQPVLQATYIISGIVLIIAGIIAIIYYRYRLNNY